MRRSLKIALIASLIGNLTIVYVGYKAYQYRQYINYWLDKYLVVVDEFSGRSVYAEENRLLESDRGQPERIVFLGTQVTAEWDVVQAFPQWQAVNRGIPGQRVAGFVLRFYPDVIELKPRAVVIEISSYNFRPGMTVNEIQDYAASMADLARAHDIEPIIGTVIPPAERVQDVGEYSVFDSVLVFNEWLRRYADSGRTTLVDFAAVLAADSGRLDPEFAVTAVDLNADGYARISVALGRVLNSR